MLCISRYSSQRCLRSLAKIFFKFKVLKMCHGYQGLSHLPAMDDEPTMHMECLLIDAGVP